MEPKFCNASALKFSDPLKLSISRTKVLASSIVATSPELEELLDDDEELELLLELEDELLELDDELLELDELLDPTTPLEELDDEELELLLEELDDELELLDPVST